MPFPIYAWIRAIVQHFDDGLLTAERITTLREQGYVLQTREDQELHGFVAILPIGEHDAVLIGLWATEDDEMEIKKHLTRLAIERAQRRSLALIVPQDAMPYVDSEVLTPKEAGRSVQEILNAMTSKGVPRKHPIRHASFRIIPAVPGTSTAPTTASP